MKYKKNPVEVDAVQYRKTFDSVYEITKWVESFGENMFDKFRFDKDFNLNVLTLEGRMMVSPGDYIIRGIEGEYYSCKERIFLKTYTKV